MGIVFGVLIVSVLIVTGLLVMRDRGTHADETPKRPQRDDAEEESKQKAMR